MKSPHANGPCPPESPERGVALVLTLLIISMLVVVVVGFVSVSRLEQVAARNATYQAAAQQMAQLATGQAVEQLRQAVQAGQSAGGYATQSGNLHPIGAAPQPLFSQGGGNTNINALTSYGWVTGAANENISVGLVNAPAVAGQVPGRTGFYIADETAKLPINFASPGRSALNPAPPRPFSIRGVDTNLPASAATSFSNILSGTITNNNTISNWSYFFTPEQVALAISDIGPVRSRRVTVATETSAALAGQTPWGAGKIPINELALDAGAVTTLSNALTDSQLGAVFGGHFGDKYGAEGVRQLAANMLQLRSDHWAGGPKFTGSDTVFGASTVPSDSRANRPIAPSGGMLKKTNGVPRDIMGYVPFPMLAEVAVGGLEYGFTIPTPEGADQGVDNNMTIRFFVACRLINPFPVDYPGGGQISVQIDKARVRMTNAAPSTLTDNEDDQIWRGPDGSHRQLTPGYNDMPGGAGARPWDPWGHGSGVAQERVEPQPEGEESFSPPGRSLTPANGVATATIPSIGRGATVNVFLPFTIVTSARHETTGLYTGPRAEMYIIVDQVRLLATAGQANTVRDWCSGPDMLAAFGQDETAQFILPVTSAVSRQGSFAEGGYGPGTTPPLDPSRWVAIAKLDPRLKPGWDIAPDNPAWKTTVATLNSSGGRLAFGPADFSDERIPADPGFDANAAMAIYNTNLPPVPAVPRGNYSMAADLGKVFTGVPWRTLRMQPQPTNEVGESLIPDWALLDMIDFGPAGQALTRVNPNIGYVSAAGSTPGFGAGLRSLMDVLTNATTLRALVDPMDPQASVVAGALPALPRVRLTQALIGDVMTDLSRPEVAASWATPVNGWRQRREELGFPDGALLLPSELAEINRVANFIPATAPDRFKENEYRLGALFPGVSTKSRFFKIYAVGEAFQGTNQQVAATALLQTLVEVNDSGPTPTITTIYQYPPAE